MGCWRVREYRVVICGLAKAGKTELLRAVLAAEAGRSTVQAVATRGGETYADKAGVRVGVAGQVRARAPYAYRVAGPRSTWLVCEERSDGAPGAAEPADALLFVVDASDAGRLRLAAKSLRAEIARRPSALVIVVATRQDSSVGLGEGGSSVDAPKGVLESTPGQPAGNQKFGASLINLSALDECFEQHGLGHLEIFAASGRTGRGVADVINATQRALVARNSGCCC